MSADTLTPDAAAVIIAPPPPEIAGSGEYSGSYPYAQTGFAVMGGNPDEILIAADNNTGDHQYISGYDLSGNLLFRDDLQNFNVFGPGGSLALATIPDVGVAASWIESASGYQGSPRFSTVDYAVVGPPAP